MFKSYEFDRVSGEAAFHYSFDDGREFTERVFFAVEDEYDTDLLDRALFLSWLLIGASYYKCFPVREVQFIGARLDDWQADFLNMVYQEGLSQYAFENDLTREDLAHFTATAEKSDEAIPYDGAGILALQSGGKDSLLMAQLLEETQQQFDALYISSTHNAPAVLHDIGEWLIINKRVIDIPAIKQARAEGGRNGHVPVTYIILSIGLIQAILSGKQTVVASIGHEGEEPHAMIGDLPVNHQWSKTWPAEQSFAEYVARYISPDLRVGSPLRSLSELKISQLFAEKAWDRFGHNFSSCNRANYQQGEDNTHLTWCGDCPKCANAFLLFAPFVRRDELTSLFGGKDLFTEPNLTETFKGLLGIDGVMKPFECIGEIDELRYAYHKSLNRGYQALPFEVPESEFDVSGVYPAQIWAQELIQPAL